MAGTKFGCCLFRCCCCQYRINHFIRGVNWWDTLKNSKNSSSSCNFLAYYLLIICFTCCFSCIDCSLTHTPRPLFICTFSPGIISMTGFQRVRSGWQKKIKVKKEQTGRELKEWCQEKKEKCKKGKKEQDVWNVKRNLLLAFKLATHIQYTTHTHTHWI